MQYKKVTCVNNTVSGQFCKYKANKSDKTTPGQHWYDIICRRLYVHTHFRRRTIALGNQGRKALVYRLSKGLAILGRMYVIFRRETRFSDLIRASLSTMPLPTWGLLRHERTCNPRKSKIATDTRSKRFWCSASPWKCIFSLKLFNASETCLQTKTFSCERPRGFSSKPMVNSWTLLWFYKETHTHGSMLWATTVRNPKTEDFRVSLRHSWPH